MRFSTIIMIITSVLFLAMGLILLFSKSFNNLSEKRRTYVKLNSMIYIFIAIASLIISIFDYMTDTKVTMYIFMAIIFISSIVQFSLSKKIND